MSRETTPEPEEKRKEPPKEAAPPVESGPARISIKKFFETELRVAKVLAAERVPDTDRLLKLQIDLGSETRQLVAGIAEAYEPEALVGKRIIVVANLEPARIRGVESQGMLLAADLGGRPILATFDEEIAPGTPVR